MPGRDKLTFEEVDYSFLQEYNTKPLSDGMKVNGVSNYMRTIRALFNKAKRRNHFSKLLSLQQVQD